MDFYYIFIKLSKYVITVIYAFDDNNNCSFTCKYIK